MSGPPTSTARERSDRAGGGPAWKGGVQGRGKFAFNWSPKKVSDACFGQRFLEYHFLQIAGGKTITSSFKHAVSDIFIIMFSERAPLEMTYISMSPKVICEVAKRPSGGGGGGIWAWYGTIIYDSNCRQNTNIKHAVSSDTFIIIISERVPLELTYISMSPKVICEENCEGLAYI